MGLAQLVEHLFIKLLSLDKSLSPRGKGTKFRIPRFESLCILGDVWCNGSKKEVSCNNPYIIAGGRSDI